MFTKTIIPVCLLFLYSPSSYTQCLPPTAQVDLEANNVSARLAHCGNLWSDGLNGEYNINGLPIIDIGGIWIGGITPDGQIKVAASTYGLSSTGHDFFPGPLQATGSTDANVCTQFDRFWSMTAEDVAQHQSDFATDGVVDGPIPPSILAWPGNGNPQSISANGFELPTTSQGLAPFVDIDNDGIYDPTQGDYPDINEADQAIWYVFNDAGNIHTESGGGQMQIEVQTLAYAYEENDDAIDNTTFYDYKIINRGVEPLDSAFVGLWVDPARGCANEQYLGCRPESNLAFVYSDADLDCSGNLSDEVVPVVGFKILQSVESPRIVNSDGELVVAPIGVTPDTLIDPGLSSFTYYNNGGINPPPPPGTVDPNNATQYYRYLSGSWRDGTPLTEGGSAYDPSSSANTTFAFPDNPSDPAGWSMCTAGQSGLFKRMIIGSGPFRLEAGAVDDITFAVIYTEEQGPNSCPDISMFENVSNEVTNFYENRILTHIKTPTIRQGQIKVYPNPMFLTTQMYFNQLDSPVTSLKLYNSHGQLLRHYIPNTDHLTIERGQLSAGMLIYQATTRDAQVYTGKILIID